MFDALDYGPGNSLLAGIGVVIGGHLRRSNVTVLLIQALHTGIPFPIVLYFYGEKLRERDKYTQR